MVFEYVKADLRVQSHASAVVEMVNSLAEDEISGCQPLDERTRQQLIPALRKYPNSFTILSFVDGKTAGMSLCFESLSSFKARPIVNIHDFIVKKEFRGLGIANGLLKATEKEAKERKACKLTLEVLEGNTLARKIYTKYGFCGYELDPNNGKALFWEKSL